ncbi:putative tryptophan halogenase [Lyophyllum shimeji]|uniref:Tryptophan halogenase n=1 Tax=Lyophyllum shimeji TaxID=47721 RepID=A0A9P3UL87_LYOSH|nr:putative tryptophan halogenase [Lyophyllum shimeji]
MSLPPQHTDILIIGGGPAGSYAASALAREGLNVTVFEADKFPRYHVGESLIPSVRQYFRFIDAESVLAEHGFVSKPGSSIKFNQFKREGYTDFIALGCNNNAWNVVRSEFDQLLMNHARTSGASVYELTKVTGISFSPTDPDKPVSVTWSHTPPPQPPSPPASPVASASCFGGLQPSPASLDPRSVTGSTTFTHLIDATGRAGILSTKYLKNRHFNASLKNVAVWGYWNNTGMYGVGTPRQGAPWFEALTDESGWAWFIPLHDGTTSVGIVMNQNSYNRQLKLPLLPSPFSHAGLSDTPHSTMTARYLSNLSLAPGVVRLITASGHLVERSVKSASDFSYSAPSYAGKNYRIVGDAGAFIDPFFSSGVHLALTSALSAAATICASIRGDCCESDAADWHTKRVSTSYTRFQVVVLSAYKQIRAQSVDILSDIDEDNYDRAFSFLRPVIQGASDMGKRLSETELQKSLDFCVSLFNPTSPEQHERLANSPAVGGELLDVNAPVMDPVSFESALRVGTRNCVAISHTSGDRDSDGEQSSSDSERTLETKMVLDKINARRVVHAEYRVNNMESEPIGGYVMRLQRGRLGLLKSVQRSG